MMACLSQSCFEIRGNAKNIIQVAICLGIQDMFSPVTVDDDGGRGPDVELMAVVRMLLIVGIMLCDDGGNDHGGTSKCYQ